MHADNQHRLILLNTLPGGIPIFASVFTDRGLHEDVDFVSITEIKDVASVLFDNSPQVIIINSLNNRLDLAFEFAEKWKKINSQLSVIVVDFNANEKDRRFARVINMTMKNIEGNKDEVFTAFQDFIEGPERHVPAPI